MFFLLILATAIGGRSKPELCFLPGRMRWTLLPKERYGNSQRCFDNKFPFLHTVTTCSLYHKYVKSLNRLTWKHDNLITWLFCVNNKLVDQWCVSYDLKIFSINVKIKAGCYIGEVLLNHLMFADDICVFCPSVCWLQRILDVCQAYAESHGIIFNCNKTICMTFKAKSAKSTPLQYWNWVVNM